MTNGVDEVRGGDAGILSHTHLVQDVHTKVALGAAENYVRDRFGLKGGKGKQEKKTRDLCTKIKKKDHVT